MTTTDRGLLARLLYEQLPSWWQQRQARKAERQRRAAMSPWEAIGYRKPSMAELCAYFDVDPAQFTPEGVTESIQTEAMLYTLDMKQGVPGAKTMLWNLRPERIADLNQALQFMHDQALIDCWVGKGPESWKL